MIMDRVQGLLRGEFGVRPVMQPARPAKVKLDETVGVQPRHDPDRLGHRHFLPQTVVRHRRIAFEICFRSTTMRWTSPCPQPDNSNYGFWNSCASNRRPNGAPPSTASAVKYRRVVSPSMTPWFHLQIALG